MEFNINFRYLDGKDFAIILKESDIADFIKCLSSGEVFFNDESKTGIWIPIDKIRHFTMKERQDGKEGSSSIGKVSGIDEKAKGKKGAPR